MQGQNQELRALVQSFSERVGLGVEVPAVGGHLAGDTAREVRAILAIAEKWLRVLLSSSSGVRYPEGVERVMRYVLSRLHEVGDLGWRSLLYIRNVVCARCILWVVTYCRDGATETTIVL